MVIMCKNTIFFVAVFFFVVVFVYCHREKRQARLLEVSFTQRQ